MLNIFEKVLKEIGLYRWPPFLRDNTFLLALLAGVIVWIVLWLTVTPTFSLAGKSSLQIFFTTVLYYPLLEEILFRGIIQGKLSTNPWCRNTWLRFSFANWITSLLFVGAHFWYQPASWAVMVLAPSLLYGYFRDKFGSTYPAIALHVYYNAGFMAINFMAQ